MRSELDQPFTRASVLTHIACAVVGVGVMVAMMWVWVA